MIKMFFTTKIVKKNYIVINGIEYKLHKDKKYFKISIPNNGSMFLHRFIMELVLNRKLLSSEHVHHIDGNGFNNNVENLEVVDGRLHNSFHTTQRNLKHNPDNFKCVSCSGSSKHKALGMCLSCFSKHRRKIKTKNPCKSCGKEIGKLKNIINNTCPKCITDKFTNCNTCYRKVSDLPKSKPIINTKGNCRACQSRIDRANN